MVQVVQSSDQLIQYLSWTDGHNRRLFPIFRKLRNWQEKSSFKGNCRINGGQICRRETIQYGFIRSCIEYYVLSQSAYKTFSYPVFPLSLKWHVKWRQIYSRSSFTSLTMTFLICVTLVLGVSMMQICSSIILVNCTCHVYAVD